MVLTINKGGTRQLSPHFNEQEWYSTSSDAPASHPIDEKLIKAAEFLRTYFNVPWRITSAFRTPAHEAQICRQLGVKYFASQHVKARAFDSHDVARDPKILAAICADFIAQGEIYAALREIGITGFGLYDWGIHLDCRSDQFTAGRRDKWGKVAHWDERSTKKKAWGAAFSAKENPSKPTPTVTTAANLVPAPTWPKQGACPGGCSR